MKKRKGISQLGNKSIWVLWTLIVAVLFFMPYLWLMVKLPGLSEQTCLIGASFTLGNVLYSAFMSILTALMVFGLWILHKQRSFRFRMAAGGAIGGFMGFFTVFCTWCTLPIVSIFGFSLGIGFFTTHNVIFKSLSIALMAFVLWMIDDRIKHCKACA